MTNTEISRWKRRMMITEAIFSDFYIHFKNDVQFLDDHIIDYQIWTQEQKDIFSFYLKNQAELINRIKKYLKDGWSITRMEKTALAIMLEALAEYDVIQTPFAVLIQQAVLSAQKICSPLQYKTVNAILNNYFKDQVNSN